MGHWWYRLSGIPCATGQKSVHDNLRATGRIAYAPTPACVCKTLVWNAPDRGYTRTITSEYQTTLPAPEGKRQRIPIADQAICAVCLPRTTGHVGKHGMTMTKPSRTSSGGTSTKRAAQGFRHKRKRQAWPGYEHRGCRHSTAWAAGTRLHGLQALDCMGDGSTVLGADRNDKGRCYTCKMAAGVWQDIRSPSP